MSLSSIFDDGLEEESTILNKEFDKEVNLIDETKSKKHKFNLKALEDKIRDAYASYDLDKSSKNLAQFYLSVKELASAVLQVGTWKGLLDYEISSHDYATWLTERLMIGKFNPQPKIEGTKFPYQQYIRFSIRNTVYTDKIKNNHISTYIEDIIENFSIDGEEEYLLDADYNPFLGENVDNIVEDQHLMRVEIEASNKKRSNELLSNLLAFYSIDDVKRLYPLASTYFEDFLKGETSNIPEDIMQFNLILICLAKRSAEDFSEVNNLFYSNSADLRSSTEKAINSSLLLSAISGADIIPRSLSMALDFNSLYRLSIVSGGSTVKIPTIQELEEVVVAISSAKKMLSDGLDLKTAKKHASKELMMTTKDHRVKNIVNKILLTSSLKSDPDTDPVIHTLAKSINSLTTHLNNINTQSDKISSSSLIEMYKRINESLITTTTALKNI
jgi:hypothetical protein